MQISVKTLFKQIGAAALATALILPGLSSQAGAAGISVDASLPNYIKIEGVAGNLNSIGSDTLNNLMTFWGEGFRKLYPNVNIQIEGKGSSTAPPALIEGTAQLGPMSRPMKNEEIDTFEGKYGFKPTPIGVALDSLAVYVNKDNPVDALSLPEIDAIFSKSRKGGYPRDIVTWGQVGAEERLAGQPISVYGRNSASGTYGYFKKHALFKGDYKDIVKEQPGSASVVLSVTEDQAGIGYSGIGYKTSGVKALAVSREEGGKSFEPDYANVLSGNYPLGRMLYVYVVKKPNEPMQPLVKEFLKYVLSTAGQETVVKDGYLPLPAEVAAAELVKLD